MLGVRYLITGTAQRHGNQVRVNAELIDARRGVEIWSQGYERARDDLFALQDEIADAIVSAVEPEIIARG